MKQDSAFTRRRFLTVSVSSVVLAATTNLGISTGFASEAQKRTSQNLPAGHTEHNGWIVSTSVKKNIVEHEAKEASNNPISDDAVSTDTDQSPESNTEIRGGAGFFEFFSRLWK